MPDPDLTLELSDARDEVIPERGGVYRSVKRYTFYLGKFGPIRRAHPDRQHGRLRAAGADREAPHAPPRAAPLGRPAGALMLHPRPAPPPRSAGAPLPPPWALWATLAVVVALRVWAPAVLGAGHPGDGPPPLQLAWLSWVVVIAGWIKTSAEVISKLTLIALRWAVANLTLVVARLGNGLKALGHLLLVGVKDTWGFFRATYEDVIKPSLAKLWRWYKRFVKWLDDTFGPLLKHLRDLRDSLLKFWKTYVQPWLDLIDVTRRILQIFGAMGLDWAKTLDRKLAQLEAAIEKPFRLVLAKLNEVIDIVNRVITLDGLVQRVALIKSLARDYQYAWRAIVQPYAKTADASVVDELRKGMLKTTPVTIAADYALLPPRRQRSRSTTCVGDGGAAADLRRDALADCLRSYEPTRRPNPFGRAPLVHRLKLAPDPSQAPHGRDDRNGQQHAHEHHPHVPDHRCQQPAADQRLTDIRTFHICPLGRGVYRTWLTPRWTRRKRRISPRSPPSSEPVSRRR
jgi:hypothetical protein